MVLWTKFYSVWSNTISRSTFRNVSLAVRRSLTLASGLPNKVSCQAPINLKRSKIRRPPANVHEVRQFLGLCNFFRCHVRNFAQITAPLTALTKKECSWKGGPLPPEALTAFQELQTYLCSEPVVDYPRRDRPYALIADASLGDGKKPGGLGAILTQLNPQGEHCVIAYASRKLQKHECNYTPFLLEMQAAIWGMVSGN